MAGPSESASVVDRFINELWNQQQLAVADELFAPDAVTHQLRSTPGAEPSASRGPAEVKAELRDWFSGFPDIRLEVEQRVSADDVIVTRYAVRGTHRGTWLGIPATNVAIIVRMIHTVRVRDGRIVEDWLLADWHGMLEQLGLVASLGDLIAAGQREGGKNEKR